LNATIPIPFLASGNLVSEVESHTFRFFHIIFSENFKVDVEIQKSE
jgi:hypothetical protein